MPLYARTEKRIRRKEREDKLGITAVKDAMKENGELEGSSDEDDELDLDDESESELDDEDEDESEVEDEEDDGDEEDSEVDAAEGAESDADEEEDEDEDEGSDSGPEGDDEPFPLTIDEVESNPIYPMDDNEGCLLCPGKTLKNPKMKETHLASTSHKRAMRRWTKRLAQVDERPLPSDDPRDVMNEILDDLEDQRSGLPVPAPTSTSTSEPKSPKGPKESKKRTLTDTEPTPESSKKQKREGKKAGKAQRKAEKAEKALKAIEAANASGKIDPKLAEAVKNGGEGTSTIAGTNTKGLNRKARRLLAHKLKEAEEKGKKGKEVKVAPAEGKGVKDKEVKGDGLPSAAVGEKNGKTKSKKSRKST